jgi:hypothetical protein
MGGAFVLDYRAARDQKPAATRDAWMLLLWVAGAIYLAIGLFGWRRLLGFDAHAYWLAWHHHSMYGVRPNQQDAYLYSPAFAQLIWPLAQLPWSVFVAGWTAGGLALYFWLLKPLGWQRAAPLALFCVPQAMVGNIWPLLAVVLAFGFRHPGLWAFALLTKVTAGVGVVWFAVRGEWRKLARVLVPTGLIVAVSAAISPGLWVDWLHLLAGGGAGGTPAGAYDIPLVYRLPVALALAIYAAKRGRPAFLAASMGLACPVFALSFLLSNLVLFAALPRLERAPRS